MLSKLYEIYQALDEGIEAFTTIIPYIAAFFEGKSPGLGLIAMLLVFGVIFRITVYRIFGDPRQEKPLPPPSPPPVRDHKGSIITPPPKIKKEQLETNVGDVTIEQFGKTLYHKRADESTDEQQCTKE